MKEREKSRLRMTKAERLLYLINLIKSHHNLTSKELAEKCGVSERTIFRDLNSLASVSFPIYYDQGYKFLQGAFLPTLNLTDEELSVLKFAFEFSPIKSNSSLFHLAKDISAKLETSRRKSPSEMPKRLNHTEEVGATSESKISRFSMMFKLLNLAIDQQKMIRIRCRKRGNRLDEFLIEPYALVSKNGDWLVLCYCSHCRRIVFYDVNKIQSVSLTTQTFKSKINLDKLLAVHE